MNLKEIVKQLREQGHSVVYKLRGKNSIIITAIDSEKFPMASKAGNRRARQLSGNELSAKFIKSRHAGAVKGGLAKARISIKKPKAKQWGPEKEYQRLRRLAKKKGLKPIGKRQIKKAMKRGEKWKDIRKSIIKTYRRRYSQIANHETKNGVAMFLHEKRLSPKIALFLWQHDVMARDLQNVRDAAYDALKNHTYFNESYWLGVLEASAEEAKQAMESEKEFASELSGRKRKKG